MVAVVATADNPRIRELEQRIADLEAQIAALRKDG
jgi:uncharacterized coiled-coil protein SlyX